MPKLKQNDKSLHLELFAGGTFARYPFYISEIMCSLFINWVVVIKQNENVHRFELSAIRGELLERERER